MTSTEQVTGQLKCVPHGTPTLLRCASCDTPVCPKCGRLTEVGQKCLGCAPLRGGRSRRSRLTSAALVVGGVLALVVGIGYLGSDSFQKSGPAPRTTRVTVAAAGAEVADQRLAFRVERLECAGDDLEFDGESVSPQGQFCYLTVKVRNDRRADAVFSGTEQYLIDATGRRYDMDVKATVNYARPSEEDLEEFDFFFLREVSPREDITGVLVYDIPTRARVVEAEFHYVVLDGDRIVIPSASGAKVKVHTVPATTTTTGMPDPSESAPPSSEPAPERP